MKITAVLGVGLLVAWIGWTEETMAEENKVTGTTPPALVLELEPLAPDEVLATLDIVSKQGRLGGKGGLLVREGQVTVGRPILYALEEPKAGTGHLLPMPNGEHWRFYLVVFRLTLHPPPGERRYREMTFKVALTDPRITAFQLLPERVSSEETVTKSFDIGFSISLPGGTAVGPIGGEVSANATRTVQFAQLRPVITAYGDGQSEFYWRYTVPSHMPVDPGARRTAAVLQVPASTERLSATILWEVELERNLFADWRNVPVSVDALPLEVPLR